MADLPLAWEELRHRQGNEASADIPKELRELMREKEPPKRETRSRRWPGWPLDNPKGLLLFRDDLQAASARSRSTLAPAAIAPSA